MMNIKFTKDQSIFNFLTLNRDVDPRHVRELGISVDLYGCLRAIILVKTSVFGVEQTYILDGQHLYKALVERGKEIPYVVVEIDSKRELAQMIATLNNTAKTWRLENYLRAWASIGIEDYLIVKNKYNTTGIQLSLLVQFYGLDNDRRAATRPFKNGEFKIENLEKSIELIQIYKECLPYVNQDYHKFLKDFASWIIGVRPEKAKLLDIVKNNKIPEESIKETLDHLYNK